MSTTSHINAINTEFPQNPDENWRATESEFFKKMLEIPAFHDTYKIAMENKYGKIGFQMVGSAGLLVSNVTKPFHNQIKQADTFAANSVGYVSEKFPYVQKPTAEIVDNLKKPALQTITTVKQYQETFGSTLDNRCIIPAKNIASSVHTQINQRALDPTIAIAKKVDSSLINIVDRLEFAVENYLPEDEDGNERKVGEKEKSELLQTLRALNIAYMGHQRLTKRVKAQISNTQVYTAEQLKQLQESNQLLKNAVETINSLNQMLLGIVANVRDTVANTSTPELSGGIQMLQTKLHDLASIILGGDLSSIKSEDLPKAVQTRVIDLSQVLLQTTDSIANYVKQNAKNFPEYLQDRVKPLTDFFEESYSEILKCEGENGENVTSIEKAKRVIQLTSQHVLPLLKDIQDSVHAYSSSLNEKVKSRFVSA